jgi:SAM-dependent methyltransferase
METKEQLQENLYHFPYHHITHEIDGGIFIFRHLFWGLEHYTYIKYVIAEIQKHNPGDLVDIGCGEGRIISEVQSSINNLKLFGCDISSAAIRFAKAFVPNVDFATHDIVTIPLDTQYSTAVSCEVIEHIKPEDVNMYCRNIAASLSINGFLFLTTPTTNIPTSKKHYQHFTRASLEQYLSPYFEIEYVAYLNVVNIYSKFLNFILGNRLFISNFIPLNRWILRQYKAKLLVGTESTGSRIFIKARKK